ncbi:MFS transporter [soil metagenome]
MSERRRLRRSSTLAGLGDGVLAVALPLLAAGVSRDPLAVAGVLAAHHLPWGVLAVTRRSLVGTADQRTVLGLGATLRAAAVVVIGLLGLVGAETTVLLVVAALVAGLGAALADGAEEEFAGLAESEPLAGDRRRGELRRRGMVAMAVVGLPLGGLVYELAAALPFLVDAGVYSVAALSALALRRPFSGAASGLRAMGKGRAASIPALAPGTGKVTLAVAASTAAGSAVLGVLVLFALDDLGLGAPAFGLILRGMAGAATAGAWAAPTVGGLLGLRGGAGITLGVSGAGYATASVLADPGRPLVAVVALGLGSGAAMIATVLLRALLHGGAGRALDSGALADFHARVWSSVPLGMLAGGVAAQAVGVPEVVTAGGLLVGLTALTVAAIPAPGGAPGTSEKN